MSRCHYLGWKNAAHLSCTWVNPAPPHRMPIHDWPRPIQYIHFKTNKLHTAVSSKSQMEMNNAFNSFGEIFSPYRPLPKFSINSKQTNEKKSIESVFSAVHVNRIKFQVACWQWQHISLASFFPSLVDWMWWPAVVVEIIVYEKLMRFKYWTA